MRQDGSGRDTVFPWSDARDIGNVPSQGPPTQSDHAAGDTVYSGASAGRVVSVDATAGTMRVIWNDANTELDHDPSITYPLGATYLRKAMPWE